jgi:hypothetical protein
MDDLVLSQEQQDKLVSLINQFLRNPNCAICNSPNWGILDRLYEIRQFAKGSILVGGGIVPLVVIVCKNCGHIRFMNAITIGFVDGETGDFVQRR